MTAPLDDIAVTARFAATAVLAKPARPRIVVVGAGFGGLSAAIGLAKAPVDVVVVDRRNYHLFQPLLYQVATAALAPSDIASPIRSILRNQRNATVLMGRVTGVNVLKREVLVEDRPLPYDTLIVATGARHAYFGRDEWEATAPELKKIDDATDIRRRILSSFERAETTDDDNERRKLLTFVVVGAGPTGVEMAGAIAELAKRVIARDFRRTDPRDAKVVLVEAGPRVLPSFPPRLSAIAEKSLRKLGVETRLGKPVTGCDSDGATVGDERIPAATIVWAAGVMGSPASKWLQADRDAAGRVIVEPDLTLPGHPEIFVIGDTAHVAGADGRPLPGIAPVAKQQGHYVARLIRSRLRSNRHPGPFRYLHFGNLATIGRRSAVADFGRIKLSGLPAWLFWGLIHIYFLIGFRNRIIVLLDWLWAYAAFEHGARLITHSGTET